MDGQDWKTAGFPTIHIQSLNYDVSVFIIYISIFQLLAQNFFHVQLQVFSKLAFAFLMQEIFQSFPDASMIFRRI
jgi:hypothetical protein